MFRRLLCPLIVSSCIAHAEAPAHRAGAVFKDCESCPEMLVIPAGSFQMGSPASEIGRHPDEGPQHMVTFKQPFAISRHHILAEEYAAFVKETGMLIGDGDTRPGRECKAGKPRYPQGPRQPAVCIDYSETLAYISWLSKKTGKPYRLLSEAEFEYAAKAGSTTPFPFAFDDPDAYTIDKHANTYGEADGHRYTSPAAAFPPNAFGAYDMHGNVSDRVADCQHDNYIGAPSDGSAWLDADKDKPCTLRRMRGNDWIEPPVWSRSSNRNDVYDETRGDWLGFRVAVSLPPSSPTRSK
jgi:formylglycine-generating enzyme required for sulfatase activity